MRIIPVVGVVWLWVTVSKLLNAGDVIKEHAEKGVQTLAQHAHHIGL